ncbi:MAG TPA: helix-turn-helix domain-containing protein [Thermoleophilaceae bacterium]
MAASISLLPRSPHRDLRTEISASQHGRLLVAMADVVGERGYAATTVADVIKAAGVSRRTFYEHFPDKEACFLAAYQHGSDALASQLLQRFEQDAGWRERVEGVLDIFLGALAAEPGFARAFLIEIWAAGPAAYERHIEIVEQFHTLMRAVHEQARVESPGVVAVSDTIITAVTGGIARVATMELLAGRAARLPELKPELLRFGLALLAGSDPQLAEDAA